jgi:hypothetical protein
MIIQRLLTTPKALQLVCRAAGASLLLCFATCGLAQSLGTFWPQGTYTDFTYWANYPSSGYFNFDKLMYVANDPKPRIGQVTQAYFYSHQFGSVGGDGGYIGIQTDGNGKRAIFSWWAAIGASCSPQPGAICRPFSGEGTGYQTMIPYSWQVGHYYRTRVWIVSQNNTAETWVGAVQDRGTNNTAGTEVVIGYITVPRSFGYLSYVSVNWVEWYAPRAANCDQLPYSSVTFYPTQANAGAVTANFPGINHLGGGNCPSTITNVATPAGPAVRHENGKR